MLIGIVTFKVVKPIFLPVIFLPSRHRADSMQLVAGESQGAMRRIMYA